MKVLIYIILLSIIIYSQARWTKLNGPEGGFINSICTKGDTLVIGSGDTYGIIFYSLDAGKQWHQSNFLISERIMDFIFTDDNSVLAACQNWGIYKSNDFINWTRTGVGAKFLSFGKDDSGRFYAGTEHGEIFFSTDNGENWTTEFITQRAISSFLYTSGKLIVGGTQRILTKDSTWRIITFGDSIGTDLKIFSDNKGNIFAGFGGGILISNDTGQTWRREPTGTFFYGNLMYDCTFNSRIIGAFGDESGLFGDGWGAAVSNDLGITWRWSTNGLPPKITGFRFGISRLEIYLGTHAAGVFRSTDFGDSWSPLNNGLSAAIVTDINFDNDGTLYTSSWANGLAKSTDLGKSWETINANIFNDADFYCIMPDDNGILFSGSAGGIFRSSDKGGSWETISQPGNGFIFNLRKDKKNRIYALTYGSGLYRSTDKGESWTRLDQDQFNGYFLAMAFDDMDYIYAGDGRRIFRSTDDGQTWTKVFQSAGDVITGIAISPNGNIFASVNYMGVIKSTDRGITWELKSNGVSTKLFTLNIDRKGNIYTTAMYSGGIWKSTDDGESWIDISSNLSYIITDRITFYNDEIYLGTFESIWKANPDSLTNITDQEIKTKEYSLSQNYPNPFNPTTTIKYSLPEKSNITIIIYDALGREITKLLDEEKPAGEYEVNWNAENYPTGVYFCRMKAGNFIETRKLILMK